MLMKWRNSLFKTGRRRDVLFLSRYCLCNSSQPVRTSFAIPYSIMLQSKNCHNHCPHRLWGVGFQASMRTAANVNGQLRYFVSFVLNMYTFILCVVLQLYSFTWLYSLLLHNKIHYIFRDRTDSHLSPLHCIAQLRWDPLFLSTFFVHSTNLRCSTECFALLGKYNSPLHCIMRLSTECFALLAPCAIDLTITGYSDSKNCSNVW